MGDLIPSAPLGDPVARRKDRGLAATTSRRTSPAASRRTSGSGAGRPRRRRSAPWGFPLGRKGRGGRKLGRGAQGKLRPSQHKPPNWVASATELNPTSQFFLHHSSNRFSKRSRPGRNTNPDNPYEFNVKIIRTLKIFPSGR